MSATTIPVPAVPPSTPIPAREEKTHVCLGCMFGKVRGTAGTRGTLFTNPVSYDDVLGMENTVNRYRAHVGGLLE